MADGVFQDGFDEVSGFGFIKRKRGDFVFDVFFDGVDDVVCDVGFEESHFEVPEEFVEFLLVDGAGGGFFVGADGFFDAASGGDGALEFAFDAFVDLSVLLCGSGFLLCGGFFADA